MVALIRIKQNRGCLRAFNYRSAEKMDTTKRVLFLGPNAHGHINALVGIADRLRQDLGYQTRFLLLEPALDVEILGHGHELTTIKPAQVSPNGSASGHPERDDQSRGSAIPQLTRVVSDSRDDFQIDPVEGIMKIMGAMIKSNLRELKDNYDSYVTAIEQIRPDLIITDASIFLPYVYKSCRVPWVRLYPANPLLFCQSKLPGKERIPPMVGWTLFKGRQARDKLRLEEPDRWRSILHKWRDAFNKIMSLPISMDFDDWFREHNIEKELNLMTRDLDSPYLNLFLFPRDIDYDLEDDILEYPKGFLGCDVLMRYGLEQVNESENGKWTERLNKAMEGKQSLIYFSLGTMASSDIELMRRFVDMFKLDQDRLYVISKGVRGDELELDPRNMLGANYLPQTFFLERADLAIVHGGNNTLTECLYFGRPMIVLPVFADQLDNAQRLVDLDLGIRLNVFECSQTEMRGAIDRMLLDQHLINRLKLIGQRMRARDDPRKVSMILKKLVEEGSLSQDFLRECREKECKDVFI